MNGVYRYLNILWPNSTNFPNSPLIQSLCIFIPKMDYRFNEWRHYIPRCGVILWKIEPLHDKTNKVTVRPAKTQISLGIRPVWSESSLSAWRKLGSLATHSVHSEDSDQTGRMPRLIWVFPGRRLISLVLSCRGSIDVTKIPRNSHNHSLPMTPWGRNGIEKLPYCS